MKRKYFSIIFLSLLGFTQLLARPSFEEQKFGNKMQEQTETWLRSTESEGSLRGGFIGEETPDGKNTFGESPIEDSLVYLVVLSIIYVLGKKKMCSSVYYKKNKD